MRDQVIAAFEQHLPAQAEQVLDIGCGEGTTPGHWRKACGTAGDGVRAGCGEGCVRYGAKRYPQVRLQCGIQPAAAL